MTTMIENYTEEEKAIYKKNMTIEKAWLKTVGETITADKQKVKDSQRSGECEGQWQLHELRRKARHHHIAYSELRGNIRENIENPREGNEPDEAWIQSIKNDILYKE